MSYGYLPHTESDVREMLEAVGARSLDDLFAHIPREVQLRNGGRGQAPPLRTTKPGSAPGSSYGVRGAKWPGLSQGEVDRLMAGLAEKNVHGGRAPSFLGAGCYDHEVPAAVEAIVSRGEFATAYTPYQPEASQGTLQAIFEAQTMLCELTGMDVATASHYDDATALAEAALLARAVAGGDGASKGRVLVSRAVHPHARQVLDTYLAGQSAASEEIPLLDGATDLGDLKVAPTREGIAAIIVQQPNALGRVEDLRAAAKIAHASGALLIVSANPISLGLLEAPGAHGADICVGNGQSLGNGLAFGGPTFGFFTAKTPLLRRLPGRIVGKAKDAEGREAYTLVLQTREQHIRREKATSNICTNQSLNLAAAAVYLSLLGPAGLREVAMACLANTRALAKKILAIPGFTPLFTGSYFHEVAVRCPVAPSKLNARLLDLGFIGGLPLKPWYPEWSDGWLLCATETKSAADLDGFVKAVRKAAR